jgi:hypothetical protein
LPYAPGEFNRASLISGLEKLLAANDRLTAYQSYLSAVRSAADGALPPARR